MVTIVKQTEIPSISHAIVCGVTHNLGYNADFRKSPVLADFIPEEGRLSMSWVGLQPGEVLDVHLHPTKSMIIVCSGQGKVMGDLESSIEAGDIVVVPEGHRHGFVGTGEKGFSALSIQFEGEGLYEDQQRPRVAFEGDFFGRVNAHAKEFKKNEIMDILRVVSEANPPETHPISQRLFRTLHLWSRNFQTLIAARLVFPTSDYYWRLAQHHMEEELYHDRSYDDIVAHRLDWYPEIDAISAWFRQQLLVVDDVGKTILMCFVIEKAGDVFYTAAAKVFKNIEHFVLHGEADKDHVGEAVEAFHLDDLREHHYVLLDRGWEMMNKLLQYMARYATEARGATQV